jgi:hypothetical protein
MTGNLLWLKIWRHMMDHSTARFARKATVVVDSLIGRKWSRVGPSTETEVQNTATFRHKLQMQVFSTTSPTLVKAALHKRRDPGACFTPCGKHGHWLHKTDHWSTAQAPKMRQVYITHPSFPVQIYTAAQVTKAWKSNKSIACLSLQGQPFYFYFYFCPMYTETTSQIISSIPRPLSQKPQLPQYSPH